MLETHPSMILRLIEKSLTILLSSLGIVFTILGVVILDFCCDGCQTPCRTLMIDLCHNGDQTQGLATFTVTAGLGGAVGYAIGGSLTHLSLSPSRLLSGATEATIISMPSMLPKLIKVQF